MTQQYLKQQMPSVMEFLDSYGFDGDGGSYAPGSSVSIPYIDVMEVTPETTARIAKHAGEDGTVFSDTRIVQPARYRAIIAFPAQEGKLSDVHKNLLNASHQKACKYTLTSYFSRCWNMMVVSSRNRDTPDMQGLRLQEVVFEECLEYEDTGFSLADVESPEDSSNQTVSAQLISVDGGEGVAS